MICISDDKNQYYKICLYLLRTFSQDRDYSKIHFRAYTKGIFWCILSSVERRNALGYICTLFLIVLLRSMVSEDVWFVVSRYIFNIWVGSRLENIRVMVGSRRIRVELAD